MALREVDSLPGFSGQLNATILSQVEKLSTILNLPDLKSSFAHLSSESEPVAKDVKHISENDSMVTFIDHTQLQAIATSEMIEQLCKEAIQFGFKAVCVHECHVRQCKQILVDSGVLVASVCDFPLGQSSSHSKAVQAQEIVNAGADEIDMVLNVGLLKGQKFVELLNDVNEVRKVTKAGGVGLKVILETCNLTTDEIIVACIVCVACGVDFVKTSTGFANCPNNGATPEAVDIMLTVVGPNCQVKASGGIRDAQTAMYYLRLGVTRIGTSSGKAICQKKDTTTETQSY